MFTISVGAALAGGVRDELTPGSCCEGACSAITCNASACNACGEAASNACGDEAASVPSIATLAWAFVATFRNLADSVVDFLGKHLHHVLHCPLNNGFYRAIG